MRRRVLPPSALASWTKLHGVSFNGMRIVHRGDEQRGFMGEADCDVAAYPQVQTLMTVPVELILSAEAVEGYAKVDAHLRALLGAVGELAQVYRTEAAVG